MNENTSHLRASHARLIETGEWSGWTTSAGDPFNDHAGPFYHRTTGTGEPLCAMRIEAKHVNGGGTLHGGAMMTFADYCLFVFATALGNQAAVTVTLHGEYLGPAFEGDLLECTGEVMRRTRSMIFLRGLMTTTDGPVFSFSGVLKIKSARS
ncbi:MAG: PaaI family thioesterase [Proteobacteria bacterium]|nr:PaaI family thioesterase [Pseudomonadota bacterium]HQR03631.1 PaaI family thioesterase [Rhodocyclaceae bacterium]